jgi:hypothetical protein
MTMKTAMKLANWIKDRWNNLIILAAFAVFLIPTRPILLDLKIYWALVSFFVLPGYVVLSLFHRGINEQLDLLERAITYLGISVGLMLIPWILAYFLHLPLRRIGWGVCAFDLIGLLILSSRRESTYRSRSLSGISTTSILLTLFILLVISVVYLYGARVIGDSWGYMAWLRNIYNGDLSPQANIFGSWEAQYPFFKNIFSELLLGYALCAKITNVDPAIIWCRAYAFFAFFAIAVNYGITKYLFEDKRVAYIAILLTPFFYVYPFVHALMDSHWGVNFIFLPIAVLFSLKYVWDKEKFYVVFVALLGLFFTIEHPYHFAYFFWLLGGLGLTALIVKRKINAQVIRISVMLVVTLLIALPFLVYTTKLALSVDYTPWGSVERGFERRRYAFWGSSSHFFVINPSKLLSVGWLDNWGIGLVTVLGSLFFLKDYRTEKHLYLLVNIAVVLIVGFNPILAPLLARVVSFQAINRLGEILPAVPVVSYIILILSKEFINLYRNGLPVRDFVMTKKGVLSGVFLGLFVITIMYQLMFGVFIAAERKFIQILNAPQGGSPNWVDRKIRALIDAKIANFPNPLFENETRLIQALDRDVIEFIRGEIESDSVFFSDKLAEYNLPVYADQLTFLGRRGWVAEGLSACPKIREEGAKEAFPTIQYPEQAERLDVACQIFDPDVAPRLLEDLLLGHMNKVDYVLVTPNTSYLEPMIDRIIPQAKIYDHDGFAIYEMATAYR